MSDTAAALIILPFLAVLVVFLECSRAGCNRLTRLFRDSRQAKDATLARSEA